MYRFLTLLLFCFFLLPQAFADDFDSRFFKFILRNEAEKDMNMFGKIAKSDRSHYERLQGKDKSSKSPEMLDVYRIAVNEKTKTIKVLDRIGEGFDLEPYVFAVLLNKESSHLAGSITSFVNVVPQDKAMLIFVSKEALTKLIVKHQAKFSDIEKSTLIHFAPQDYLPIR